MLMMMLCLRHTDAAYAYYAADTLRHFVRLMMRTLFRCAHASDIADIDKMPRLPITCCSC